MGITDLFKKGNNKNKKPAVEKNLKEETEKIQQKALVIAQHNIIAESLGLNPEQTKILHYLLTNSSKSPQSQILRTLLHAPTVTENNYEDSKNKITQYLLKNIKVEHNHGDVTISLTSGEEQHDHERTKTISSLTIHKEQYSYIVDMVDGEEITRENNGQVDVSHKFNHLQTSNIRKMIDGNFMCNNISVVTNPDNKQNKGKFPIQLCYENSVCEKVLNGYISELSAIPLNNKGLVFFSANIDGYIIDAIKSTIGPDNKRCFVQTFADANNYFSRSANTRGFTSENVGRLNELLDEEIIKYHEKKAAEWKAKKMAEQDSSSETGEKE